MFDERMLGLDNLANSCYNCFMQKFSKRDILIDGVVLILVTYYVANELSNGEFSRELGIRIVRFKGRIQTTIERERSISRDKGRVIWDAIEAVENRGNSGQAPQ